MSAQLDAAGVDLGEMEEVSEEVLTSEVVEEAKFDKSTADPVDAKEADPVDAKEAEAAPADTKEAKVKPIKKVASKEKKSTK
jgi:hypothetical protein